MVLYIIRNVLFINYVLVGVKMVKNNIEVDVNVKCIEQGMTQAQWVEKVEITSQYVNRIVKKQDGVMNKPLWL